MTNLIRGRGVAKGRPFAPGSWEACVHQGVGRVTVQWLEVPAFSQGTGPGPGNSKETDIGVLGGWLLRAMR